MAPAAAGTSTTCDAVTGRQFPIGVQRPRTLPGVVATNADRFIVVGMPCANPADDQDETHCGKPLRGASFDPRTGAWTPLPSPAIGRLRSARSSAVVRGLGMAGKHAVFTAGDGDDSELLAFDTQRDRWAAIALPDATTAASRGAALLPPWLCYVHGRVIVSQIENPGVVDAWTLDPHTLTWIEAEPLTGAVPGASTFDCAGTELLVLTANFGNVGTASINFFDTAANQWKPLPSPPTQQPDPSMAALMSEGTWLIWPWPATPTELNAYTLTAGGDRWTTIPKPVAGPAQVQPLGTNALVLTDDHGALSLHTFGM